MPSKKPRIQALMNESNYKKFQKLCIEDNRSESNFAGYIIQQYINEYEAEHGPIEIEEEQ